MQNNLLMAANYHRIKGLYILDLAFILKVQKLNKRKPAFNRQVEKTNEAYALAKISGIKLSEFLFYQKKLDVICVMPTNLYGINDNFDKFSSHVIPGMIAKFTSSKKIKKNM